MKKTETIKKNYEFNKVFSKGKVYKENLIMVFIIKNNKNKNRIGIAVSKKTGNSVLRNKIKRLIRENYRVIENEIKTGYDIILLWNKEKNKNEINYNKIKEEINKIFLKAKLIEGKK